MNPTPTGDSGGFLARNLSRILVGALVGLLVGGFFALRSPAGFEATTQVLVTRLAVADLGEASLDGTTPLDAEIRFANSGTIRDLIRGAIPTAPNTIDVKASDGTNVLDFTAPGDTANEAIRLSRNWASAYISERREVLLSSWSDRAAVAEAELELLVTQLGTARLAGDDAEAARLEARRELAASEEAAAARAISALQSDPGAELFGDEPVASETGRSLLAMAILGTMVGALLSGAWRRWREQQADDEAEADSWLHQVNEGSLDHVLTTGLLDVPSFLSPDSPDALASSNEPEAAPVLPKPAAVPPAATPAPAPAPSPAPRPAAVRAAVTVPKPAAEPLRIATINNGTTATTRPDLSRADQAWADDISLTTDV